MKVLVVGSGGREHALAWKLAQSPKVQRVYVAPGNGGTALDRRMRNFPTSDPRVLAAFVEREKIELTVVGPDAALADEARRKVQKEMEEKRKKAGVSSATASPESNTG